MSNWVVAEVAKIKAWFHTETAALESRVQSLESRLAAVEGLLLKPKDHP